MFLIVRVLTTISGTAPVQILALASTTWGLVQGGSARDFECESEREFERGRGSPPPIFPPPMTLLDLFVAPAKK